MEQCQEPILNVDRVDFDIFGNNEVKRYSMVNVIHSDTYDNNVAKIGGLIDPRMGVTDQFMTCATCKENFLECPGHFGYTKLTEPVFHWGFMVFVKNVLSCICLKTCKLLIPADELDKRLLTKNRRSRFTEIRTLCSSVKTSPYSGIPVPKMSIEIKRHSGLIFLTVEYTINGNNEEMIADLSDATKNTTLESISDTKKKVKQVLTAADCLYILKNIAAHDCEVLGIKNPADMILHYFPIPPVAIRPSIKGDFLSQGYSEHGSTHKLADIVKFNSKLVKEKERSLTVPDNHRYLETYQQCIQYHCATYFDNESMTLPRCELKSGSGNAAKSITYRFKGGKTGRIRGNLQGKRVDYSARTVITSDPNNNLDELGVPVKIAKTITYPETVTPYNIQYLTELVKRGRDSYPGANFVENTQLRGPNGQPIKIDLRYRSRNVLLRYGWIVHRHLKDGDVVLFNRQPSLHKMSMMAHTVKVINDPSLITFRMNVTATEPYNADFDGDEMNLFAPQSEIAREELKRLADIKNHIISPKDSKPIVNLKQDARLGAYAFTADEYKLSWKEAMTLLAQTSCLPKLLDGNLTIDKTRLYTGKEIMSMIIPGRINLDTGKTIIRNGIIEEGIIGKAEIGGSKNSIPHLIMDSYSKHRAAAFMDDVQRITNAWLMLYGGFTVGLGDAIIDKSVTDEVKRNVQQKVLEICNFITETENTQMIDRPHFEEYTFRDLSNVLSEQVKTIKRHLPTDNHLYVMVESGSKGKWENIGFIMGCLGQSPFEEKLIPKKLNHRSLPHFPKQDDRPQARGFITKSYIEGISPTEFFFNMMDGRSGLIDTAIKTADTGYMQRRTIKATEDVYLAHDMTVRNSSGGIVQFVYGDSGYDPSKQMEFKSRLILMDNETVINTYGFSKQEQNTFGISEKLNQELINDILRDRDDLRFYQQRALMNRKVIENLFYLPFHIVRVIRYHASKKYVTKQKARSLKVTDIISRVEEFLSPRTTMLCALNKSQQVNEKSLKFINESYHKTIFRILLREQLSPRRILVEYGMHAVHFDAMMEELTNAYNRNIIQPCEMVGILAAQSIGEPITQFTLNTFHQSGMADMGNMSAIARIKELISFTKNVKKPIIKIYLQEEFSKNQKVANALLNSIQNTMLDDLVLRCMVMWDVDGTIRPNDIREVFTVHGSTLTEMDMIGVTAPWVFRYDIDKMMLLRRDLDLLTIKMGLAMFWEDITNDQKGYKKKEKELILGISTLCVFSSRESDDTITLDVRVDFKDYDMTTISDTNQFLRERFRIKGVPGVIKAMCKEELRKSFHPNTGALVEEQEYVITIQTQSGSTMRNLIMYEEIDIIRTTTNDVFTIYQLLGIEATRSALIREINNVFSSEGHSINHQHVSILIDIMTHGGSVTPVNRYGINKLDTDPLSRASFEKTVDQLLQAAVFQEVDRVNSVSSRIMLGRVINGGTGMVSLLLDTERFEKTEHVENRYLVDLQLPDTPKLRLDPFIEELWSSYEKWKKTT